MNVVAKAGPIRGRVIAAEHLEAVAPLVEADVGQMQLRRIGERALVLGSERTELRVADAEELVAGTRARDEAPVHVALVPDRPGAEGAGDAVPQPACLVVEALEPLDAVRPLARPRAGCAREHGQVPHDLAVEQPVGDAPLRARALEQPVVDQVGPRSGVGLGQRQDRQQAGRRGGLRLLLDKLDFRFVHFDDIRAIGQLLQCGPQVHRRFTLGRTGCRFRRALFDNFDNFLIIIFLDDLNDVFEFFRLRGGTRLLRPMLFIVFLSHDVLLQRCSRCFRGPS